MNQTSDIDSSGFGRRLRDGLQCLANDIEVRVPGEFDPSMRPLTAAPLPERRWGPILAAAAIVLVAVGFGVVTARHDQPTPASATTVSAMPTVPIATDTISRSTSTVVGAVESAVTFATTPSALATSTLTVDDLADADLTGSGGVRRWYTAPVTGDPALGSSTGPALAVDSIPADRGAFPVPEQTGGSASLTIQGVTAVIFDQPSGAGRSIVLALGGINYSVTGVGLDDLALVAAAEHLGSDPAGRGGVIDPAGLPAGVSERAAGITIELTFIPDSAFDDPIPVTYWAIGDTTVFWVIAFHQPADQLELHRYTATTSVALTVHNQPALLLTYDESPNYRFLVWNENNITYNAATATLDDTTLVSYANQLRPSTTAD